MILCVALLSWQLTCVTGKEHGTLCIVRMVSLWVYYWVGLSISFLYREKSDDPRKQPFFKTINFPCLEAGLVEPPYGPDPSVVYAKDIDDIDDFSEVPGIEFDDKDKTFFQRFATGAVPVAWKRGCLKN